MPSLRDELTKKQRDHLESSIQKDNCNILSDDAINLTKPPIQTIKDALKCTDGEIKDSLINNIHSTFTRDVINDAIQNITLDEFNTALDETKNAIKPHTLRDDIIKKFIKTHPSVSNGQIINRVNCNIQPSGDNPFETIRAVLICSEVNSRNLSKLGPIHTKTVNNAINMLSIDNFNRVLDETAEYGATTLRTDIVAKYKVVHETEASKVINNPSSIINRAVEGTGAVLSSVVGSASSLISGIGRAFTGSNTKNGGKKSRKHKKKNSKTNRRRNKTKAR